MIAKNRLSTIDYQPTAPMVLFIVGPTASGKSELAMRLAREFDGEIICADSQTVRRELDIGTAKPSQEDQEAVRHHLLDVIGPYESFSVAEFQKRAVEAIKEIQSRHKTVLVVGGTGLYIDSLFYNYSLDARETEHRDELEHKSVEELQQIIIQRNYQMPLNRQNPRHLIGVILRKGHSPQDLRPKDQALIYGILPDDKVLRQRINDRVEKMFKGGFIEEVKQLLAGHGRPTKKMDAIGYPIAIRYMEGEISEQEAKELFKKGDWQYARRQKSWFKRNKYIQWYEDTEQAYRAVQKALNNY